MKAKIRKSSTALLLAAALAGGACGGKDIPQFQSLPPAGASLVASDANAGDWKMVVLTGPMQFDVPVPAATDSAVYQAELSAIKADQTKLTDAQKAAIDY